MKSVVGIFNSLADVRRGAAILRALGIPEHRISVLAPGTKDTEVEARIPTADTEQPGMGQALGGTVGAALGVAGGLEAGAAVASMLVPGVGPVLAIGLIGAALLGTGGAFVGATAGEALEERIVKGLPRIQGSARTATKVHRHRKPVCDEGARAENHHGNYNT